MSDSTENKYNNKDNNTENFKDDNYLPEDDIIGDNSAEMNNKTDNVPDVNTDNLQNTDEQMHTTDSELTKVNEKLQIRSNDYQKNDDMTEESDGSEETDKSELFVEHRKDFRNKESNYEISLVDENLLRVRIPSDSEVELDYTFKSKTGDENERDVSESNKIVIQPVKDSKNKEIEITVAVKPTHKEILSYNYIGGTEKIKGDSDIVNLGKEPVASEVDYEYITENHYKTPEEILEEKLGRKNPYNLFRKLYKRNLKIGFSISIAITLLTVFILHLSLKKEENNVEKKPTRLIVIQDIPDLKSNLQEKEVHDPIKPPEEKLKKDPSNFTPRNIPKRNVITRPRIDIPKKDTTSVTEVTNQTANSQDSLMKITAEILGFDTTGLGLSVIPDSLRENLDKEGIPLRLFFPKSWKLVDSREINKQQVEFEGVYIADTVRPETKMVLFIYLDNTAKGFNKEDFKSSFRMLDTSMTTFFKEPITLAGKTKYTFFVFGFQEPGKDQQKLYVEADVKEEFFEEYKPIIEAVVRSIRI